MGLYDVMYRVGYTPWEHPGPAWTASLTQRLDLEQSEREPPWGRAIDLGCGRGQHTFELVSRGWEVVGVNNASRAIDAARRRGVDGATFFVADVTALAADSMGSFDFFFDVGCFQHLDAAQRGLAGRGITAVANSGATLLMMAFSRPTPIGSFVKGLTSDDVRSAFPDWDLLAVDDAPTDGMDWPQRTMRPIWVRLRRRR